jgi:hypothetical protein
MDLRPLRAEYMSLGALAAQVLTTPCPAPHLSITEIFSVFTNGHLFFRLHRMTALAQGL